jgi:hypothetical protein
LRVRRLIEAGHHIEAVKELMRTTGCSLAWANLWVVHRGEPECDRRPKAPCPHCGRPLRDAARASVQVLPTRLARLNSRYSSQSDVEPWLKETQGRKEHGISGS